MLEPGSQSSSSDDGVQRPNRFQGSDNTWREWTHEERGLFASLQQQRSKDLSAHLFNAHRLSQRNSEVKEISASNSWTPRTHWYHVDPATGKFPPTRWTAWPLKPTVVPRRSDEVVEVAAASLGDRATSSYKRLEDVLLSTALSIARKKWNSRPDGHSRETASLPVERERSPVRENPPEPEKTLEPEKLPAREESLKFKSDYFVRDSSDSGEEQLSSDIDRANPTVYTPTLSADEEECARILRPIVRSAMARFDKLLTLMHSSGQHRSHSIASESESSKSTGIKPVEYSNDETETSAAELVAGNSRKRKRKPTKPNPRDWSEVVGVAGISGWDRDALQATTIRCSSLFGESMSFATIRDRDPTGTPADLVHYTPSYKPLPASSHREWDLKSLRCPHSDCKRFGEQFSAASRLAQHIRQVHKWDPASEFPHWLRSTDEPSTYEEEFLRPIQRSQGWRGRSVTRVREGNESDVNGAQATKRAKLTEQDRKIDVTKKNEKERR